jgi:pyruvate dehydrogenase (quinone)
MSQTVGDFIVERMHAWGVRKVFGYPGDGINGVFGALNRARDKIGFVQARHEEMAAFMASAYAKFSGELGVCIATSGPGASHLITGLYDARLDHMPMLAHVGQQSRDAIGGHYQQEVDLVSMFQRCRGRICAAGVVAGPGAAPDRSRDPHRPRRSAGHRGRAPRTTCRRSHIVSRPANTELCIRAWASRSRE